MSNDTAFLVVENDPNDAILIQGALLSAGCGPSSLCRNPSEAKAYLSGAGMYADRTRYPSPGIVLTDLRLDAETGIDLVQWIRKQEPPLRDIAVVILTGAASTGQFDAAQTIGAQGVYRKPSRLEDLEILLSKITAKYCVQV